MEITSKENMSLRQGLEKFYTDHKNHLSHTKDDLPEDVKSFFKSHDIAHVVFGCDISLYGEGSVKIWAIFGTTLGFWNHIKEYKKANAFNLANNFQISHIVTNFFKLICSISTIIIRAKRMVKKWPWDDFDNYLDTPISQIREEFNIRVLT